MTSEELRRFLSPETTAEILNVSTDDVHDLISRGELLAIRVGSRGPWRIESDHLELFIADQYEHARRSALWEQAELANIPELADGRII
mgnify:CR=1 FL=1